MLGLVDLLRAVKGTAREGLRRVPSKVGLGLVAVLWIGAVGAVFSFVREEAPSRGSHDAESAEPAAHRGDPDGRTPTSEGDHDGDGYDDVTGSPSWTVADGASTTTTVPGTLPGDDPGGPTGSAPGTPPSSDSPDPSWAHTTTTTPPTSGATTTTAPTTTTTQPSGGLLGGLIDLLGGKG